MAIYFIFAPSPNLFLLCQKGTSIKVKKQTSGSIITIYGASAEKSINICTLSIFRGFILVEFTFFGLGLESSARPWMEETPLGEGGVGGAEDRRTKVRVLPLAFCSVDMVLERDEKDF